MRRRPAVLVMALAAVAAMFPLVAAGGATATVPNDPLFAKQWGLTMVNAPQAWATSTGRGVTIGEVDTGVDLTHADLAAHVVATADCVGSNGDPTQCHGTGQDDNGHGTHVAGIAAAVTGNAIGVAGMAPDARLVVAKSLDAGGTGTVADVDAGIEWVVDHGAKVVNLSLGQPNSLTASVFGSSLTSGIEYAWSKGAIPVLATGNGNLIGLGTASYGALDAVVVGGVSRARTLAGYSSPTGNAKWALLAPGGSSDGVQADDVLSTYWVAGQADQYGYLAGTSMAAPLVSGTLALLLATGMSPPAAVARLLATADSSVDCGPGSGTCHGLLDAAAAVAGLTSVAAGTTGPTGPTTTLAGGSGPGSTTTTAAPAATTSEPATTVPPDAGTPPPTLAAPPGPVHGAHPAVMVPAPRTTAPASSPRPPVTHPRSQDPPAPTPAQGVAVGLASSKGGRSSSASIGWFVLLAVVFAGLVTAGINRVVRGAD